MNARFKITYPAEIEMTLTMTAPVSEWKKLRDDLQEISFTSQAGVFKRQLEDLIRRSMDTLAEERWTTGYATGAVTEKAEAPSQDAA